MSAMPEDHGDDHGDNARSAEDIKELAALARLISYARAAAEDVELVGAVHWLELAMQAVKREILASPHLEIVAPHLTTLTDSRSTH